MQTLVVAILVLGSACYAAWKLMPSVWRRPLARGLLKLPLPRPLNQACVQAAMDPSGCGCDGCDHAPKAAAAGTVRTAPTTQPITFHPRPRH